MNSRTSLSIRTSCAVIGILSFCSPALYSDCTGAHVAYRVGLEAYKKGEWEAAAKEMQEALGKCPENGKLIRTHGNWYEPYLPSFYIGSSLFELDCCQAAERHLRASVLNRETIKRAKDQHQVLASLLLCLDDKDCTTGCEETRCTRWAESNPPDPEQRESAQSDVPDSP